MFAAFTVIHKVTRAIAKRQRHSPLLYFECKSVISSSRWEVRHVFCVIINDNKLSLHDRKNIKSYKSFCKLKRKCDDCRDHIIRLHKQHPPLGAKICSDTCPRTLSVPRSEQFSLSYALGNARSFENWRISSGI